MLESLLQPRSLVVVGASKNSKKVGHTILKNILASHFRGKIFAVNPKYKKILGVKCFPSILAMENKIDLVILSIPLQNVLSVLSECVQKKVKAVIVVTAGFSETGKEGSEIEDKMKKICKDSGMLLLGPNCLGLLNSHSHLNASFSDGMIDPGHMAFISQSGAIMTALLDWSKTNHLGFSSMVSLGNKLLLDEVDFLEYYENDPKTKVILGYLEGITRGRDFIKVSQRLCKKKPFIVIKPGVTESGRKASLSHTASISGSNDAVEAAFLQCNIIRAHDLQEFFDLAMMFFSMPRMNGNRICIVANAGGPSVISSDVVSQSKLVMAQLSENTKKYLVGVLPHAASVTNPVDIVGDADSARYKQALQAVFEDTGVDAVLVLLTPQTLTEITATAKVIVSLSKKYKKPVAASFIGGKKIQAGLNILSNHHIPYYRFPHQAVQVFEKAYVYYSKLEHEKVGNFQYKKIMLDTKYYIEISDEVKKYNHVQLPFLLSHKLLTSYELPLAESVLISDTRELGRALKDLNFPLIAKIVSQEIIHKTDVGGVKKNIRNIKDAQDAFTTLVENIKNRMPGAKVIGVEFQEQLEGGMETIIGAKNDPQFGPLLMFGYGGIYTEVFRDVSFRLAPVSKSEAMEMIQKTKISQILSGIRGNTAFDIDSLALTINRVSQLMVDFSTLGEIDLNPVIVRHSGVDIVDFKIIA